MKRSRPLKWRRIFSFVQCFNARREPLARQQMKWGRIPETKPKQLLIKLFFFSSSHFHRVQLGDGMLSACRGAFIILQRSLCLLVKLEAAAHIPARNSGHTKLLLKTASV